MIHHVRPQRTTKPLQKGDEFITVAASSLLEDYQSFLEGISILESWGLICRKSTGYNQHWGYLAGTDDFRYQELHPDKATALTTFVRGGWGSARLLEKNQPWKEGWFVGYSDVSSLLLARLAEGFDGCVHGPMLTSLAKEPEWSQKRLKALLFGKPIPKLYGKSLKEGLATGHLVVANLTVASHLLGTKYFPNLDGSILIFEDVNEAPYRIDRMLTQWRLTGVLQRIAGLGFGDFSSCKNHENHSADKSFKVEEVLKERSQDLDIPIIGGLPIGHCCGNAALPLGRKAILNANDGTLNVLI